jgi:antitoxin component HigA of HigAB toxin-antitoxin module
MESVIKTEKENKVALAFVERLMTGDPAKNSKEGKLLNLLAEAIEIFEKRYASPPSLPSTKIE